MLQLEYPLKLPHRLYTNTPLIQTNCKLQSNLGFKQQKSAPLCVISGGVFCFLKPRFDCTTNKKDVPCTGLEAVTDGAV